MMRGGLSMQHTQTNINFYLDETDKKDMEQVCSQLGLSMSAAFTIFAKNKRGNEFVHVRITHLKTNEIVIWIFYIFL